jgi:hypothetical protein
MYTLHSIGSVVGQAGIINQHFSKFIFSRLQEAENLQWHCVGEAA